MKRAAIVIAAVALAAAACTSGGGAGGSSSSGGAPVDVVLWHGYGNVIAANGQTNYEAKSLNDLVTAFNATHPGIHVDAKYVGSNDNAYQKLTVALQGGEQPDITYQYGTSLAALADAPGIMDLTDTVHGSGWNWNDFYPGEQAAATVDGKVLGIPALVDNLAIVYNKDLFDAAHVPYPTADWTWDDFANAAKALTIPSKRQFGVAFPADASEDTVWHFDAMLWEGGGDILNADNTQAAFNSDAGVQALTALQRMAVTDGSMYLDLQNTKIDDLFNSGHVAMVITGPWALSSYPDVHYGVQIMPTFPGGNHQTISGPDMWVMFDNGDARKAAALEFMQWFTDTQQVKADSMESGHLPTRASVVAEPGFVKAFGKKFPGEDVFAENLKNVAKARPTLQSYDQISQIMGQAIVKVLLGQAEPKQALDDAANQVNQVLAGG
ncbi:MAG TPA: ABC transporter substrate-binding protein [Actinomycetota bacterium]|nr:ABC transporter substrate-binding protein [Actinomycetota bacterium]